MLNNLTSLNNFVSSIPICQPDTDLGSILNIFQHLNCKMLAIPQGYGDWGVIYSEDLLSLVSEAWLCKQTALVSHPKNIAALIKPAIVYQAETIYEVINQISYDSVLKNQKERLIVDARGELQGRLDYQKVIRYLAQNTQKLPKNTQQLPSSIVSLSNLIDVISLPIKIQTAAGKDLYLNKCWQQLIIDRRRQQSSIEQENTQKVSWRSSHQRSSRPQNYQQPGDFSNTSLFKTTSGIPDSELLTELYLDSHQNQNLPQEKSNNVNPSPEGSEVEQASNWDYLKVPLVAESGSFILVIAIKAISVSVTQQKETSHTENSEAISNNLLATVSHELKSPLTGIVGLSSLLKKQKLGQLNQRQTRYVELIHSSGQKMMNIVDDLLKLTSLATEPRLEYELVNLEFLCRQLYQEALTKVQSALSDSDLTAAASGLKLNIELGSEIALTNKLLLSNILLHLISKTIKLSDSLSELDIKISNLSGSTAIIISSNLINSSTWSSPDDLNSSWQNSGLDLLIAEYLAKVLQISMTSICTIDRCQSTLLLPKSKIYQNQTSNILAAPSKQKTNNLTILCLYPELEAIDSETNCENSSHFNLKSWSDQNEQQGNYQHRIIEADSLEQAHTLARIWKLDVIILDSYQITDPSKYLLSLLESEHLSALPLITLDKRTTEAANQIEGLNIYPCLLPAKDCRLEDLMQVIEIATGA